MELVKLLDYEILSIFLKNEIGINIQDFMSTETEVIVGGRVNMLNWFVSFKIRLVRLEVGLPLD